VFAPLSDVRAYEALLAGDVAVFLDIARALTDEILDRGVTVVAGDAWEGYSELYLRDLALELRRRGHEPLAFSPRLGDVAEDLRAATIPVTSDLGSIRIAPDVIHGQHHLETMAALAHFEHVPALSVAHGWTPWQETPPRPPRIRRYVAVDDTVRDRLVLESGIEPSLVRVLLNFVDLDRFRRRDAFPMRPRRAVVFNSIATEENFGEMAREACARHGIHLDVLGYAMGAPVNRPNELLLQYDLVFARGRSALEAMASGAAVIVSDPRGMAGLVTSTNYGALRRLNFGIRALTRNVTVRALEREIAQIDGADALRVADRVRGEAGMANVVDAYEELYADLVREQVPADARAEREAFASYLGWLSAQTTMPGTEEWSDLKARNEILELAIEMYRSQSRSDVDVPATTDAMVLQRKLAEYEASPFIRLRNRLYRVRPVVWLYRLFRGAAAKPPL